MYNSHAAFFLNKAYIKLESVELVAVTIVTGVCVLVALIIVHVVQSAFGRRMKGKQQ